MGICIAVLVYGVTTPDSLHTAEKLRKGSSWVSRLIPAWAARPGLASLGSHALLVWEAACSCAHDSQSTSCCPAQLP